MSRTAPSGGASADRDRTRIAIVGFSAAGLSAAETLRRSGFAGTLTVIGEEAHLPYDRPPLSKQILAAEWEPSRLFLRSAEHVQSLGLDLRLGVRATALGDHRVVLEDGGEVPFDALIIATGVRPRSLPGVGGHVMRTVDDALALRKRLRPGLRLIVVGAGFLGAECAAVARRLGCEVVLLEPAPVPLAHAVGPVVGGFLAQAHLDNGVDLRTGVAVSSVSDGGVLLADGTLVEGDEVLVAIGSLPNTDWLAGSGLTVSDGVVCDEYCAAAPDIYAAGDVARWHHPLFGVDLRVEHRTNAGEQGVAAARNLLGPGPGTPFAPIPYFWSDQYDLKIHAYGHLRLHDSVEMAEGSLAERRFLATFRRGERLVGALAVNMPPKAIRPYRQELLATT
ncbi:FAD-dependent oxidoreductase [Actinoplanes oblitus]|uniref:FAD-dependent oxidoreductase n=1 Tax=Actinoplanes oblitus TaxID=3040509 RepID=A0ABY8W723_9ACTN|nr:FAD-dependent oxidoreductase [Actinoplanes oblitus]WIM92750.1 FAD-dependent oxidoreductase [Actinoplanes oblitus]